MKKIFLTQNKVALVSDEDYDFLIQFTWCAAKMKEDIFYAVAWVNRKHTYMHILVGSKIGFTEQVDHKNKDGLDNQRENLRQSNRSQNMANSKIPSTNSSGYRGVYWQKSRNR